MFDAEKAKTGKYVKTHVDPNINCDKYLTFIYADIIEACAIAGVNYIGMSAAAFPQIYNENFSAFENRDTLDQFFNLRKNVQAG